MTKKEQKAWTIKYLIFNLLFNLKRAAKEKNTFWVERYKYEMFGMLRYALAVGDITENQEERLFKLTQKLDKMAWLSHIKNPE